MIRLSITTGDPDGIGTEVAARALQALGPLRGVQFLFWRSPQCPASHLRWLQSRFNVVHLPHDQNIWTYPWSSKTLLDISSDNSPASWVEESARACEHRLCDGLVTGPLSKSMMRQSGWPDLGHTELLARISGHQPLFMSFMGSQFNVVLTTGHIRLHDIKTSLTRSRLTKAICSAEQLRQILPASQKKLKIGVLGLNPHSGEHGWIGDEEISTILPVLKKLKKSGLPVEGPLVPDVAFIPEIRRQYSVLVCAYHDQGLVPFKMAHGFDEGVHLTLGLPFVRTSVDHGTAKELFGLNQAQFGSMKEAILAALRLIQIRNKFHTHS